MGFGWVSLGLSLPCRKTRVVQRICVGLAVWRRDKLSFWRGIAKIGGSLLQRIEVRLTSFRLQLGSSINGQSKGIELALQEYVLKWAWRSSKTSYNDFMSTQCYEWLPYNLARQRQEGGACPNCNVIKQRLREGFSFSLWLRTVAVALGIENDELEGFRSSLVEVDKKYFVFRARFFLSANSSCIFCALGLRIFNAKANWVTLAAAISLHSCQKCARAHG